MQFAQALEAVSKALEIVATLEPLNLVLLLLGVVNVGLIWLAGIAIRTGQRNNRK